MRGRAPCSTRPSSRPALLRARSKKNREGDLMTARRWLGLLLAAGLLGACAGLQDTADPKAKTALLPAQKLRVSFVVPGFVYSVKDPASGELKGIGPDLGNDLAQRLGTSLDLVTFSSPPAIVAAGKE